ncbi:MAG TPA: bifunctional precorrin-2 dehydrogenase/sirohydrochlorin ferrochelatase [Acidobacteriaceae bacterium]|jgi:precorrin-2 dehydrogenase/sirohydrochlorin ferrochelatase
MAARTLAKRYTGLLPKSALTNGVIDLSLFPIFLKLTGRPCIVIGAGHLAESKIESLQTANARVTVVAPAASERIVAMAESGQVTWHQREYVTGDLAGQFLVVAATNVPAVNRAVFAEAEAAGVLINAVDDPPFCDFYFPSVVRRGDLQIAISTAGHSPALAQRLRKEINAILPLDTGEWLGELGNLRREVLQLEPLNDARKELLHQLASREVCGYDGCPSRALAREHARTNPLPATEPEHKS